MHDQHEHDTGEQDDVEIVDLGAPDRGMSRYLFTLREKWRAAAFLRARFVALLVALCLLIAVLQAGSSRVNNQISGSPHTEPGDSPSSTIYLIDCGTTINVNSLPGQTYIWEQVMSTPSSQECDFLSHPGSQCPMPQPLLLPTLSPNQIVSTICSVGTPLPVSAGKGGKNR